MSRQDSRGLNLTCSRMEQQLLCGGVELGGVCKNGTQHNQPVRSTCHRCLVEAPTPHHSDVECLWRIVWQCFSDCSFGLYIVALILVPTHIQAWQCLCNVCSFGAPTVCKILLSCSCATQIVMSRSAVLHQ